MPDADLKPPAYAMSGPRRIRNAALAKLALLSSNSATDLEPSPDFVKLCEACPPSDSSHQGLSNGSLIDAAVVGRVPMVCVLASSGAQALTLAI